VFQVLQISDFVSNLAKFGAEQVPDFPAGMSTTISQVEKLFDFLQGEAETAIERSYFEGILADRRNHVSQAIAILEKIAPSLRPTNPHRAAAALRTLAGDYFKVGRYADASSVYSDLLQHFAMEFRPAEKRAIQDNLHTFELLRDAVPQTVAGTRNFTVPLQRDPIGDIDVPLQIGETKQWWIFDTGANISTITLSTAKRLGLTISKGRARTQGGATGAEVPLSAAVIPQLTFGGAIVRNVVALVTDDKDLDIDLGKNGHYQIQGILGYPVLAALGSFTLTGDEMVVSPESQPSARSTSLYVEDLTPLLMATVHGRDLLFGFDTGSSSAEFTAKYLREFPRQFTSLKKLRCVLAELAAYAHCRFIICHKSSWFWAMRQQGSRTCRYWPVIVGLIRLTKYLAIWDRAFLFSSAPTPSTSATCGSARAKT
jgi:predicted aspartyl protease